MMRVAARRRIRFLIGIPLLALATPVHAEPGPETCPAVSVPPLPLSRVREAVAANRELTIVAIGSSSTEGVRSSDIRHSYPAVLQAELEAALPKAHIAVLNRGVGGQDAAEMLPRLERDAIDAHPALVIWQVGANGAMARSDPEAFRRMVASGVQRLRAARVDVVLMDNQRAPAVLASPTHVRIEGALADVAATAGVGLFGRGALMDQWRAAGFPYERFVAEDGVHHNDLGYACLAKALAAAIVGGLDKPGPATSMQSALR